MRAWMTWKKRCIREICSEEIKYWNVSTTHENGVFVGGYFMFREATFVVGKLQFSAKNGMIKSGIVYTRFRKDEGQNGEVQA